ncbi:ankyrin [Xylariomycetidae sp. FL2044]|nr:ankyrin [Xylariomycetidae sp. FL2044]
MDPFTLSVSVAGLASLALELVKLTKNYSDGVTGWKEEIASLSAELEALSVVLKQLEDFLRPVDSGVLFFENGSGLELARQHCSKQLQHLHRKLGIGDQVSAPIRRIDSKIGSMDSDEDAKTMVAGNTLEPPEPTSSSRARNVLKRLMWPFKKDEVNAIVESLHRCVQTFNFCLSIKSCQTMTKSHTEIMTQLKEQEDALNLVLKILDSPDAQMHAQLALIQDVRVFLSQATEELSAASRKINEIHEKVDVERFRTILRWITPVDFQERHYELSSRRAKGTCRKLLTDHRFVSWLSGASEERQMCCFGDPGAGKSVHCSAVIDELLATYEQSAGTFICYFFLEYHQQKAQLASTIIRVILKQAVAKLGHIPADLDRVYGKGDDSLSTQQSRSLVKKFLGHFQTVYVCLDALDECISPRDVLGVLEELPRKTRIFITGRKSVEHIVLKKFPQATCLGIEASDGDIEAFLLTELEHDSVTCPELMTDGLKGQILEKLVETARGSFLLPTLHISNILGENTVKKRKRALVNLPKDIDAAYDTTIARIKSQRESDAEMGLEILAWVHLAREPFSLRMLRHAVAIEVGSSDFDEEDLPTTAFLSTCLGLVSVDAEQKSVAFVHFTLKEYFDRYATIPGMRGHDFLASKCLTCLRYESTTVPLLGYASRHWGTHVRIAGAVANEELFNLILQYLRQDSLVESGLANLLAYLQMRSYDNRRTPEVLSKPLKWHPLAYFGLCEVWRHLRQESDCDSITRDDQGWHPLAFALIGDHSDMIGLILSEDPSTIREHGARAVGEAWAIGRRITHFKFNTLKRMCRHPDLDMSKLVYGWYVILETDDHDLLQTIFQHPRWQWRTWNERPRFETGSLLHGAISRGFLDASRYMLDMGAASLFGPNNSRSLLTDSIVERVEIIDPRDEDLDHRMFDDPMLDEPFFDYPMLELLSHPRLTVNERTFGDWGWSSLTGVVIGGRHLAVRILLQREDINVNLPFTYKDGDDVHGGDTALHVAAWLGHAKILETLLADTRVEKNTTTSTGLSALLMAVALGNQQCVEVLTKDAEVDLDTVFEGGIFQSVPNFHNMSKEDKIEKIRDLTDNRYTFLETMICPSRGLDRPEEFKQPKEAQGQKVVRKPDASEHNPFANSSDDEDEDESLLAKRRQIRFEGNLKRFKHELWSDHTAGRKHEAIGLKETELFKWYNADSRSR